ncbi:dihydrofolate reductase family protein [Oleiharenicola sp. Vm1]|uniref:dihydrofolate reductase family protein n=1 Tax=Oleiharenicola sp. Vm1 TaxID=3398393 RepID=UPI0039F492E9
MRTLKILEHISLDGVIQHSADGDGFPYADWTVPFRTPGGRDAIVAAQGSRFDLLLGRRTYDLWSGYWPQAPGGPIADPFNAATKFVVTHRPADLPWGPARALGPDLVASVRDLKASDGPDLILWGSSTLTSTLLAHGLADEIALCIYPVLVGTGKRLFADGTPGRTLALVSTQPFPSGILLNSYRVAGPLPARA